MKDGNNENMIIGTRFRPQIVFKEQDMQKLYENADQPVQQVIEKILLDDLDQISNFGYGSS